MNIILLSPKLNTWSPNVYAPLGLAYIASVLVNLRHDVRIIDLNVQGMPDSKLAIQLQDADLIGITGMITEYNEIVRLASFAKESNTKALVILGGSITSCVTEKLLLNSKADIAVLGEGERIISNLVSAIKDKQGILDVKGIAYRLDDKVHYNPPESPIENMDTIPYPARYLLDMKKYTHDYFKTFGIKTNKTRCVTMITSRGCPYQCTYCFKGAWGNKWRGRDPVTIVNEMFSLQYNDGINGFIFVDDTFTLKRDRVVDFCHEVKRRTPEAIWYCNGRVNLVDQELLNLMVKSGCKGIAYGIESGNQQILDSIKKGTNLDQIRQAVKWTKEAGIHVTGYFMLGSFGETKQTIQDTINFARDLDLDFYGFSITTALPGTEMYDVALKNGLVNEKSIGEWSLQVNTNLTKDCSDDDLKQFANAAFKEFHLGKQFGKHYLLNPALWRQALTSIRGKEQAKELVKKSFSLRK